MDGQRFDDLTKGLADRPSRRGVLRGLAGGTLAALFGGIAAQRATAQVDPARTQLVCANQTVLCNRQGSTATRCGGRKACSCALLANGDRRCVFNGRGCPARSECDKNRDCDRGEVCIRVAGCCRSDTGAVRACARRCN